MASQHTNLSNLIALESSCIPVAVYQFRNKRVATVITSQGFCEMFGFRSHEEASRIMDDDMYCETHPDDVARIADAAYHFATAGGTYETVYRSRTYAGGDYRIIHAQGRHVYDERGERYAVVWYTDEGPYTEGSLQDEKDLGLALNHALHAESMVFASRYDSLTGLPNMGYFFELADARRTVLLQSGESVAFLFINLSGMKFFNRTHGFAKGDRLIREVGSSLAAQFGNENCSRFGQDHFAVITTGAQVEDAIRHFFSEFRNVKRSGKVPFRVGIYLDVEGKVEISTACDRARLACDTKRGSYYSTFDYYDANMLAAAERRHYIINNLDRALAEGWVQVYYQPIVRTANGRVCDEEALARWIDPERGMLSPAEFIPVLEDMRLIYKLDLYVVEQVLRKMHHLMDAGLYLVPSSINLSRSDFETCDIVEEVRRRVDASGIARSLITIEITESTIGSDFEYMKRQVERFHELGFSVWMDDFGSEYSSLDYLQRIPFDLMKLDMRFMQQFDQGDKSKVILTELMKMAISLDIDTVAEGVETQEQVDFLREVGCSKLQGYFFSRPNSEAQILERYATGTAIGFENPEETPYYTALSRINLYDLSSIARDEQGSFEHYFNTLPMAIIESTEETFMVVRCNNSYRTFMEKMVGHFQLGEAHPYAEGLGLRGGGFLRALRTCAMSGQRLTLDEQFGNGSTVHAFVRRIANNPVSGTSALGVAVLAVADDANAKSNITFSG